MSNHDPRVLAIEPHILRQASLCDVQMPDIYIPGQDQDVPFLIDQSLLLSGLVGLSLTPETIHFGAYDRTAKPNPDIASIGDRSFRLSYSEGHKEKLTSEKLNKALWLGCLMIESENSPQEKAAYARHRWISTRTSSAVFFGAITDLFLTGNLPQDLEATNVLFGLLASAVGLWGLYKYSSEFDTDYYKKRRAKQAEVMATAFPALSYQPWQAQLVQLDQRRQRRTIT